MSYLFAISEFNTFYSAPSYPQSNEDAAALGLKWGRNKEMRALTIAAFRIAQNNSQLSSLPMNLSLLLHLLANSKTAIEYWEHKGRLIRASGEVTLTPNGIAVCQNTLNGRGGAYSTSEDNVREWVHRMINSDHVANIPRTFPQSAWREK